MLAALQQLDEALAAIAAVDVDSLTDSEVDEFVIAVQRHRHRLAATTAPSLSRWDRRAVWAGDGSRSAAARLGRDCRTSIITARIELRRARQLASMPHTAAAVCEGRLSMDHVDLLGRASQTWRNAVFADHEAMLVEECTKLRFRQAQRMVDYWCQRADAEAAEHADARKRDAAHFQASETIDGTVVLNGVLDPVGGAIVVAELARLERLLYLQDERDGVTRTAGQRRAAAVVEMAARSAAMPEGAQRPKPLFTVLLGDDGFARLCELTNGTVISPGALTPWLSTAELEMVLFSGKTTIVSVSTKRSFTGAVRRAVQVRDRHCQHPSGCDIYVDGCDVDHIVPHAAGGETSQFDGRLECTPHNRDAVKHDHDAQPHPTPARPPDRLDELRARLRWRYLHDDVGDDDGDDSDTDGDDRDVESEGDITDTA